MSIEAVLNVWLGSGAVHVRRRIRVLMLLDAADYALISPLANQRFHALAFLADVLSPLYDFAPLSGRVLKRRVGPYFPDLQWEVDRLVGLSLVECHNVEATVDSSTASIEASNQLNRERALPVLSLVYAHREFLSLRDYFRELATALSDLEDKDLDAATQSDVTWEAGFKGAVIDYAEWKSRNYSRLSVGRIQELASEKMGDGFRLSAGAQINLYVQYLRRAANG